MDKPTKTRRRARASLAAAVVLAVLLVLTTVALGASFVRVDDNLFETGRVEIALNGGKPVFTGGDLNIEPGHTLVRDFTVENLGTARGVCPAVPAGRRGHARTGADLFGL